MSKEEGEKLDDVVEDYCESEFCINYKKPTTRICYEKDEDMPDYLKERYLKP